MRLDVVCGRCGNDLDGKLNERQDNIVIDPCENCLEKERNEGKEEGIKEGKGE